MKKRTTLLLICLCSFATLAFAGGSNKTYYFKTTVSAAPSGAGTVYASTSNAEGTYQESITVNPTSKSGSSVQTTDIYLWHKASTGYTFIGWDCAAATFDGNKASVEGNTSNSYVNQIKANFIPTGTKIYQVENSDFETWNKYGDSDHAPDNWNSFETNTGSYASMASAQQVDKATDVRPGSTGSNSVKIYSRDVLVAKAQGNLTTGRINAGATTAANKANHNFTDVTNGAFNQYFGAHPDAVKVWVKFVPESADSYARVALTTHDAYNYITYGQDSDNTTENESHAYSHAALNFQATSDKGWQELTIPFTLTGNNVEPTYIVANFSTNNVPGGGSANDVLYIDDMELVYNSELSKLVYDGAEVAFTDGAATIQGDYDESKLGEITTNSLSDAAIVETNYNAATRILTITVKGEDFSVNPTNIHTYTITFEEVRNYIREANYTETIHVNVTTVSSGSVIEGTPKETTVNVGFLDESTIDFNLDNFFFQLGTDNLYVGNIKLRDLALTDEEYCKTFSYSGNVTISNGTDPADAAWMGSSLGEIPLQLAGKMTDDHLYVTITIDMAAKLGQSIFVQLGDDIRDLIDSYDYTDVLNANGTIVDNATAKVEVLGTHETGKANVVINDVTVNIAGADYELGNLSFNIKNLDENNTFNESTTVTTLGLTLNATIDGFFTENKLYANINILASEVGMVDVPLVFGTEYDYTREVVVGKFGSICLPMAYGSEGIVGATIYSIEGKKTVNGTVKYVSLVEETEMKAGQAYLFEATMSEITFKKGTGYASAPNNDLANGLVGVYGRTNVPSDCYIVTNNKLAKGDGNTVGANRAYIDLNAVPELTSEAKGIRFYLDGTDGVSGVVAATGKANRVYNLAGLRMAQPSQRGVYIVDGKKVLVK